MKKSSSVIETHGADPVPTQERTRNWWDLFVILAGVNITLATFLAGGLLVPGLGFWQAVLALGIGNAILCVLMAWMGAIGTEHGLTTAAASRVSLGYPRGTWIGSLAIVLALGGWFAVNAELAGMALNELLYSVSGRSAPTAIIIILGLTNAIPAILGYSSIRWLSTMAVPGLIALCLWLLAVMIDTHGLTQLIHYTPTGSLPFATGVDLVIGGYILGVYIAPDVTRYVRGQRDTWIGVLTGVLPVSVLLGIMGALSKLATGDWSPVTAVSSLGLGWPAMILIVFATWTTNDINIYSSGLALTNLHPTLGRWRCTVLVSVLGTALAALRVSAAFEEFLMILDHVFAPLIGIMLADYMLIRKRVLDVAEASRPGGAYYYRHGINRAALIALVIGIAAGIVTPPWLLTSLTALIAAGAAYIVIMSWPHHRLRRHVCAQGLVLQVISKGARPHHGQSLGRAQ